MGEMRVTPRMIRRILDSREARERQEKLGERGRERSGAERSKGVSGRLAQGLGETAKRRADEGCPGQGSRWQMVAGCRSSWQRGAGWRRSRQGDSGRAGEGKQGPRARSYLSWAGRKISGGGGGERIDGRGRQRAGVRPSSETTSSAVSPARRPRLAAAGIGGADTFRHLPPPHPPPPAALGHSPPIADSSPPPASFRASSVPASACRSSFSPPSLLRFFLAIVPPSVTRPLLHPPRCPARHRPVPDARRPTHAARRVPYRVSADSAGQEPLQSAAIPHLRWT